jgi:hypothetical protein
MWSLGAGAGARMVAILDDLQLTGLVTTIAGLTPVGAAAILAETGDPARFTSGRSLVKHAGLCSRDNASGGYQGKTPISGRGRPALRVAAWRAVWARLAHEILSPDRRHAGEGTSWPESWRGDYGQPTPGAGASATSTCPVLALMTSSTSSVPRHSAVSMNSV